MALQIALVPDDTLVGYAFPESYAKIEFVRSYKAESYIWVNWYADAAARHRHEINPNPPPPVPEDGSMPVYPDPSTLLPMLPPAQPVRQKEFLFTGDSTDFAQYYDFLKQQPEFAGAIDV